MSLFDPHQLQYRPEGGRRRRKGPWLPPQWDAVIMFFVEVLAAIILATQFSVWVSSTSKRSQAVWQVLTCLAALTFLTAAIALRGKPRSGRAAVASILPVLCFLVVVGNISEIFLGIISLDANAISNIIISTIPLAVFGLLMFLRGVSINRRFIHYVAVNLLPVCIAVLLVLLVGLTTSGSGSSDATFVIDLTVVVLVLGLITYRHLIGQLDRRRARLILLYLEQIVSLDLPLPETLKMMAQREGWIMQHRMLAISDGLAAGDPLDRVLRDEVPEMKHSTIDLLTSAIQSGQLPRQLVRLRARDQRENAMAPWVMRRFYVSYFMLFMLVAIAVFTMVMVFVMPKFESIFADFKLPLTPVDAMMLAVSGTYLPAFVLLLVFAFIFSKWPRRALAGAIWHVPLLGAVGQSGAYYEMCDFLTGALEADTPLPRALRLAAFAQSHGALRRRLTRWSDNMEIGRSIEEAAREADMPDLIISFLTPARNRDLSVQTFQFLRDFYESRFERWNTFWQQVSTPIIVAVMGTIALLVALAIFQPMVTLLQKTADFAGSF